jgi:hypothetical protein
VSTDVKKHISVAAGEVPARAAIAAAIFSINDIIPVANATEAGQVATAAASAGQVLASAPITVARADAPGMHRAEISNDGSVWRPLSSVLHFSTTGARDTWTTANSALLTAGDACWVTSTQYTWNGSVWYASGGTPVFTNLTYAGIYSVGTPAARIAETNGTIRLEGRVFSTSQTHNAGTVYTFGSIPVGQAPVATRSFVCDLNQIFGIVTVDTAGTLTYVTGTTFTGTLNLSLHAAWPNKNL